MIRQMKKYSNAFMELKLYEEPKDITAAQNSDASNKPTVHLKSK
jgi:hypothetical protein